MRHRGGDFFHQVHEREPQVAVVDGREGLGDPERARVGDKREQRARGIGIGAVEQGGDRDAQDGGDPDEAPGADPVGADLILLELLKGDVQPLASCACDIPRAMRVIAGGKAEASIKERRYRAGFGLRQRPP